jgi:hypothetical protein
MGRILVDHLLAARLAIPRTSLFGLATAEPAPPMLVQVVVLHARRAMPRRRTARTHTHAHTRTHTRTRTHTHAAAAHTKRDAHKSLRSGAANVQRRNKSNMQLQVATNLQGSS